MIYGKNASQVSSLILFIASCLPAGLSPSENPHYKTFGYPLEIIGFRTAILPHVSLTMLGDIQKMDCYLIGVTNKVFLTQSCPVHDIVLTLPENERAFSILEINQPTLKLLLHLTDFEERMIKASFVANLLDDATASSSHWTSSCGEDNIVPKPSKPIPSATQNGFQSFIRSLSTSTQKEMLSTSAKVPVCFTIPREFIFHGVKPKLLKGIDFQAMKKTIEQTPIYLDRDKSEPLLSFAGVRNDLLRYLVMFHRLCAFACGPTRDPKMIEDRRPKTLIHDFNSAFTLNWIRNTINGSKWLAVHDLSVSDFVTDYAIVTLLARS